MAAGDDRLRDQPDAARPPVTQREALTCCSRVARAAGARPTLDSGPGPALEWPHYVTESSHPDEARSPARPGSGRQRCARCRGSWERRGTHAGAGTSPTRTGLPGCPPRNQEGRDHRGVMNPFVARRELPERGVLPRSPREKNGRPVPFVKERTRRPLRAEPLDPSRAPGIGMRGRDTPGIRFRRWKQCAFTSTTTWRRRVGEGGSHRGRARALPAPGRSALAHRTLASNLPRV